ncbi:MAG: Amidohydrolase [Chloroflexi bacterium]|nr:Amidohydrolase [Chloroflexota bacterium]
MTSERITLPYLIERHGPDRFLMGTDFPHGLGGASLTDLRSNPTLSEDAKEKLLGLNAAKLFGLPTESKLARSAEPAAALAQAQPG